MSSIVMYHYYYYCTDCVSILLITKIFSLDITQKAPRLLNKNRLDQSFLKCCAFDLAGSQREN